LDQRNRDVLERLSRPASQVLRRGYRRAALALAAVAFVLALPSPARAAGSVRARILPTGAEVGPGQWMAASQSTDERTRKLGAEIDQTVAEGVEDLGLVPLRAPGGPVPERSLTSLEPSSWVFAPRLSSELDGVHLRLVAVAPGSRVELVREEVFTSSALGTLDVRTLVMLRDLYDAGAPKAPRLPPGAAAPRVLDSPAAPPSTGKPVLALNGAVLGGYFGFAIQRASGSSDSRLVYPLVALGTGLGLGASLLVADEWNISTGDAWYLSAGMWWPLASGVLLAQSYGVKEDNVYLYGLVGAGTGLALASTAVATHPISEGGAVLAHSGGAFGALLGAMTDAAIQGTTGESLKRGIGYGTGIGVVLGGAMATQVTITPSRALLVDLSASLGAVAGAALASPLLLVDESDPVRTRLWLASAGAGTIAGGIVGWYATASSAPATPEKRSALSILPYGGITPSKTGSTVTLGVVGAF
jgi:hypothetical protein